MKGEYIFCECGSRMYRVRAQSMKGDIPMGYYCPSCKAMENTQREYLVPADLITRMDPFFLGVSKREAYLAILKTKDLPMPRSIPDKTIETIRERIGSEFVSFCRPAGDHEPARLDRGKFDQESQEHFDNQVRAQEIKEAALNQPHQP